MRRALGAATELNALPMVAALISEPKGLVVLHPLSFLQARARYKAAWLPNWSSRRAGDMISIRA